MSATSRLELRLPREQKERIERAAALAGTSLTRFVLDAVLARARELDGEAPSVRAPRPIGGWSFELPDDWDDPLPDFDAYR